MNRDYLRKVFNAAIDDIEAEDLVNEESTLREIQEILIKYNNNDFECIEKIMAIMEKNGYNCRECHDF